MDGRKKFVISDYEIFLLCIKQYFMENEAASQILLFVVGSVIARSVLYTMISDIVFELESCSNILNAVTRIFVYRLGITAIEGIANALFERSLGRFQARISTRVITNILRSEVSERFEMTSGKSQYFISKGADGLSRVIRILFVDVSGRLLYVQIDLYRIYSKYGVRYLVIGLILLVTGLLVHMRGIFMVLVCKKKLNNARAQVDKKLYEIIFNYETVKAYQTEEQESLSFKRSICLWEKTLICMKNTLTMLEIAHNILFRVSAFVIVVMLCEYGDASGNRIRNMYSLIASYDRYVEDISKTYGKIRTAILNSSMALQYLGQDIGTRKSATGVEYFHDKLEFSGVEYVFEETSILRGLNFTINKGDKVAIYGRNGAGKSVLFKLILRMLEPCSGNITIDGISISNINMRSYRSLITYIPQQADVFDDTVYNNLRYGNNKSYHEVIQECKRLNAHEDILKLSGGYNTVVGERGKHINSGLKQKICCIRALLRDSFIYLFDEPTSNLDKQSEDAFINTIFDRRFAMKTFLVICHVPETMEMFPKTLRFH